MGRSRWSVYAAAFVTGVAGLAVGSGMAAAVAVAHASLGFAITALLPWRWAMRARHHAGAATLATMGLVMMLVVTGLLHATGAWVGRGSYAALTLHVVLAVAGTLIVATVGLARWWIARHRKVPPAAGAPPDGASNAPARSSRRTVVTGAAIATGAAAARGLSEALFDVAGWPGGERRSTGSFEVGSFDPVGFPVTEWWNDEHPNIDAETWHLDVVGAGGRRSWSLAELATFDDRRRATIDCTGAWFSTQHWEGVRLDRLLTGQGRSIHVRSRTGYWRAFPRGDADHLLVAVRIAGQPLTREHGAPARLVAPDRRGFWWVKWIDEIALSDQPWWWQPPFPLR